MGCINYNCICVRVQKRLYPIDGISRNADCCGTAQSAALINRSIRAFELLLDVLRGNKPCQAAIVIQDEQLLDLCALEDLTRLVD